VQRIDLRGECRDLESHGGAQVARRFGFQELP
jgi:hypothetical protein